MRPFPNLEITLIAAVSEDGIIGTGNGGIPWRLPRDAAHFRNSVADKAMLLGRITYGEMRGWFRDERPIVLTADRNFRPREAETRVARSLSEALEWATTAREPELMVCGGASVYALALPLATRMILTHIDTRLGDAFPNAARFPCFDPSEWRITREQSIAADAMNLHASRIAWSRREPRYESNTPAAMAPAARPEINAGNAGTR